MNRMTWTTFKNGEFISMPVCLMSVFYKPGDGTRALVIGDDNRVHEVDPYDLALSDDEYNKIFL